MAAQNALTSLCYSDLCDARNAQVAKPSRATEWCAAVTAQATGLKREAPYSYASDACTNVAMRWPMSPLYSPP